MSWNIESNRLESFRGWTNRQMVKKLALYGFYNSGPGQNTRCFACGLEKELWLSDDNVLRDHLLYSPHCQLLNRQSNNVPIDCEEFDRFMPIVVNRHIIDNDAPNEVITGLFETSPGEGTVGYNESAPDDHVSEESTGGRLIIVLNIPPIRRVESEIDAPIEGPIYKCQSKIL